MFGPEKGIFQNLRFDWPLSKMINGEHTKFELKFNE